MNSKPRILITCDYYLPGFKAGGPIVSIENLCHALKDDFDFYIFTRPHDFKDATLYNVPLDTWVKRPEAQVCYRQRRTFRDVLQEVAPDLVYHNSLFSPWFTLWPLLCRRVSGGHYPVLLAPRGEAKPSALQYKALKKKLAISLLKHLKLLQGVHFHATNPTEVQHIQALFPHTPVHEAWDLCQTRPVPPPARTEGPLRVLFFSRLSRVKNPLGALQAISQCQQPMHLTIAGPKEDPAYWAACQTQIENLPAHIQVQVLDAIPRDEIAALFHAHDVFFLPTQGENHGHVIIEALAHGCVPLISDQTPWTDLQKYEAGFVLHLENAAGFAQTLDQLAHRSPATWASWQANGYAYLQHHPQLQAAVAAQRCIFQTLTTTPA